GGKVRIGDRPARERVVHDLDLTLDDEEDVAVLARALHDLIAAAIAMPSAILFRPGKLFRRQTREQGSSRQASHSLRLPWLRAQRMPQTGPAVNRNARTGAPDEDPFPP